MTSSFFSLNYPSHPDGWIAALGPKLPKTEGANDLSTFQEVAEYLENWTPDQEWVPPKIHILLEDEGKLLAKTDRPFNDVVGPIFSQTAITSMKDFLEREGRILPLDVENLNEPLFLWWVPLVENSVNFEKSEKYSVGNAIKTYVFNEEKVEGLVAFRPHYALAYKPHAQSFVFVSEEFCAAWNSAGLSGIRFSKL